MVSAPNDVWRGGGSRGGGSRGGGSSTRNIYSISAKGTELSGAPASGQSRCRTGAECAGRVPKKAGIEPPVSCTAASLSLALTGVHCRRAMFAQILSKKPHLRHTGTSISVLRRGTPLKFSIVITTLHAPEEWQQRAHGGRTEYVIKGAS